MTTEQEEMIRIRVERGELLTTYQQKDLLVELDRERKKRLELEDFVVLCVMEDVQVET